MSRALFQRIVYGIILIFAVVVLNFLLIHAAPGDVVDVLLTEAGGGIRRSQPECVLLMDWTNPSMCN